MNEFVATVIGDVNAALKKKGWKKRGRAPSIEAIVEKTTELLRVATDKELAAAYGGDFCWASSFHPRFIAALMCEGFLTMATEAGSRGSGLVAAGSSARARRRGGFTMRRGPRGHWPRNRPTARCETRSRYAAVDVAEDARGDDAAADAQVLFLQKECCN